MKRLFSRDRLFISQWYIGSGNRISTFSQKPKRPFEEIKELYLMETETIAGPMHHTTNLSAQQRQKIKARVKEIIRKQNIEAWRNSILSLLISIVLFIGVIFIGSYLIEYIRYFIQTY
ncbi:MAG: hypothetical protein QM503_09845 [Bacteroidota bacterium]